MKNMNIYLDMDGVIANFFGAFAKANNVDHWKSIKQKEKALADLVGTDWFYKGPFAKRSNKPKCETAAVSRFEA